MKIIGVELRAGYRSASRSPLELKLIPFELVFPSSRLAYEDAYLEITVHTSEGDRTVQVGLPSSGHEGPQAHDGYDAMKMLRAQLER